jgi:hypothetical protein
MAFILRVIKFFEQIFLKSEVKYGILGKGIQNAFDFPAVFADTGSTIS